MPERHPAASASRRCWPVAAAGWRAVLVGCRRRRRAGRGWRSWPFALGIALLRGTRGKRTRLAADALSPGAVVGWRPSCWPGRWSPGRCGPVLAAPALAADPRAERDRRRLLPACCCGGTGRCGMALEREGGAPSATRFAAPGCAGAAGLARVVPGRAAGVPAAGRRRAAGLARPAARASATGRDRGLCRPAAAGAPAAAGGAARGLAHGLPVVEMDAAEDEAERDSCSTPMRRCRWRRPARRAGGGCRRDWAAAVRRRAQRPRRAALALLEAGADPHAPPPAGARDQRSLPVLAAVLPDLRLLRALIDRGVDLNAAHAGHDPAARRHPRQLARPPGSGDDPARQRRRSARHRRRGQHAAAPRRAQLRSRRRRAAARCRRRDSMRSTATACRRSASPAWPATGGWRASCWNAARRPSRPAAQPVLLAAAGSEEDDPAGVQLLLRHKARVDARDARGRSALHEAALRRPRRHLSSPARCRCRRPMRATAKAARRCWKPRAAAALPTLEALLDARRRRRMPAMASGANALHLACAAEAPSRGAGAAAARTRRRSARHRCATAMRAIDLAAAAGRWTLVAALDPHALPCRCRCDDDDARAAGPPAAAAAARSACWKARPSRNWRRCCRCSARRPGRPAVRCRGRRLRRRGSTGCCGHGANPEAAGAGPRRCRCRRRWRAARTASSRAPAVRAAALAGRRGGLARFLGACLAAGVHARRAAEAFALELLERGADPFAASPAGDPPLALAVRLGWPRLLQRLVAHGVDLDAATATA